MGERCSTVHRQEAPLGGSIRRVVIWFLLVCLATMLSHDAALARAAAQDAPLPRAAGLGQTMAWHLDHTRAGVSHSLASDTRTALINRNLRDTPRHISCGAGRDFHVVKRVLQLRADPLSASGWIVGYDTVPNVHAGDESRVPPTSSPQVRRALLQVYRI